MYFDANSFYATAMCEPLSVDEFAWMEEDELLKWEEFVDGEGVGCVLEVDLEYPRELHDFHNDYPLAPESICVGGVEKLIPNIRDKKRMVLHGKNLQLYLSLGLKLKKIWRGVSFREEAFMKPYIELNTKLRTAAKNDFEKDFFKLMSNIVFGKTMENVRKRANVFLVNSRKEKSELVSKINFEKSAHFRRRLSAIHMQKLKVKMTKPIFCGAAILDLSKCIMYRFYYGYAKKKWEGLKVLCTDTDSLIYEIETEDVFADTAGDVFDWFDTSGYSKDHPAVEIGFPVGKNKNVPGMFKDECGGKMMKEFAALRSKCYSVLMDDEGNKKKCKGVKKNVVEKELCHEDYKTVLFSGGKIIREQNLIQSKKHDVFTLNMKKIALSPDDDKRIVLEDGISTLAFGHWRFELEKN